MENTRILFTNDTGGVSVIVPTGAIEDCIKDVPAGKSYEVVDVSAVPTDRTFRNAWERSGATVTTNITKAKDIAHDKRRAARAAEFAPLDVEATIPSKAAQAEAARQAIRDRYAVIQSEIDAATTVDEIKAAMP